MTEHELMAAAADTGIPADRLAGYIEAGATIAEAVEAERGTCDGIAGRACVRPAGHPGHCMGADGVYDWRRRPAVTLEDVRDVGCRGGALCPGRSCPQHGRRSGLPYGCGIIESQRLPEPVNGFAYVAEIVLLRGFEGQETDDVVYGCQRLGDTPPDAFERCVRAAREIGAYAGYSWRHVRGDAHVCPRCSAAMDRPARACDACMDGLAAKPARSVPRCECGALLTLSEARGGTCNECLDRRIEARAACLLPTDLAPRRHPRCDAAMCGLIECKGGTSPCYVAPALARTGREADEGVGR